MPFDGSGNFTRVHKWTDDRDNNIKILADRHDAEDDNFASAFNLAFMRTGIVPMTGNLNMGSNNINAINAGTVTVPSVVFSLSNLTGFYQPNSNALGFTINGTERFEVNNVGAHVFGALSVDGAITAASLTASGLLTASAGLAVTGGTTTDTLHVTGALTASGGVTVTGAITATGDISSSGVLHGNGVVSNGSITATSGIIGVQAAGLGAVQLISGDATHTGYIGFFNNVPTRIGYIGFMPTSANSDIAYENDNGGNHVFNTSVGVNGTTITLNASKAIWQHDGTNGFFRTQTGQLNLGAAGSNDMYIDTSHNVTINHNLNCDGTLYIGDGNFYISNNISGNPGWAFNPNCFMNYNRGSSVLSYVVNGTTVFATSPGVFEIYGNFTANPGTAAAPAYRTTADSNSGLFAPNVGMIGISCSGVEKLRVGATEVDVWDPFIVHGQISCDGSSSGMQIMERDSSKNWLHYGSNGFFKLWSTSYGDSLLFTDVAFEPMNDAAAICGATGHRWNQVWCVSSSMTTSDVREKRWRGGLNDNELDTSKALIAEIGIYQWLRDLDKDGEEAKLQCGIIAQRAIEIFKEHGLNALDYGFVRYDEWEEETHNDKDMNPVTTPGGNRYSIMFPDLIAFMMVGQEQRLSEIEAKVEHLRGYGERG
jgi:hypothetical protein